MISSRGQGLLLFFRKELKLQKEKRRKEITYVEIVHFGPWTKLLRYSKLHIWHLTDLCRLNNFIWKNRANFSHSETHFPLFVATCTTCIISMSHVLIWILVNDSFLFDAFILHLMFWKHTFHGNCVQRLSSVLFVLRMQPELKMAYSIFLKV